jgi:hypothetical protein
MTDEIGKDMVGSGQGLTEVLLRHLPEGLRKSHTKKYLLGKLVSRERFETSTSIIQVYSATSIPACAALNLFYQTFLSSDEYLATSVLFNINIATSVSNKQIHQ